MYKGKQVSSTDPVKLKASVNSTTGEVSFYIDKEDIKKIENKQQTNLYKIKK